MFKIMYTINIYHSLFSSISQLSLCFFSCSQLLFFHFPSLMLLLLALVENLGQASWFELPLLLTVADHSEFLVFIKIISIKVEVGWKVATAAIKKYGEFLVWQKLQQQEMCWNYNKHYFLERTFCLLSYVINTIS